MFSVCVRDHVMIAHSFRGELFGPAQALHGATYVVDLELRSHRLDTTGVVADIDRLGRALRGVLDPLRYRNLDREPALAGVNTTTEYLAQFVFEGVRRRIQAGELGAHAGFASMRVVLHESHVAWAAYEQSLE
jgi:6-pyruvoyl-tetrahydropterin synthase